MPNENEAFPDYLRPVAPLIKWWVVGIAALLLGLWEIVFHAWFMGLPMVSGHRLNALVSAVLVAGVTLAFFRLVQGYEQRLARAAAALREKNEAFRALEAERDTRLLDLSRDLALALAEILWRCEEARQLPKAFDAQKTLTAVETRIHELQSVIRAMVELRHHGDGLTDKVPAILEEYQRYRDEHPRKEVQLTDKDWEAIRRRIEQPGARAVPEDSGFGRGVTPDV